jgi:hypothetical protein
MNPAVSYQPVAAPPIRALIIQPDNTYEVREITQDIRTMRELVGGKPEAVPTDHCVLWCNDMREELPCNRMATYLWWKLQPEMEAKDMLAGPVFVTGRADEFGDGLPVPEEVVELYERMEKIRAEHEDEEAELWAELLKLKAEGTRPYADFEIDHDEIRAGLLQIKPRVVEIEATLGLESSYLR